MIIINSKGDHMIGKRMVLVLALACAFTLAFAGVAFAAAGDNSNYTGVDNSMDPWALNVEGETPHTGYGTTTVKCAVCHAVHRAEDNGFNGEVLLRGTVGDACVFCHIQANVSSIKVYGANAANYNGDFTNNHMNAVGSRCVDCHTVHGAGAITAQVGSKILKSNIPAGEQAVTDGDFTAGTDRGAVVTAFCTQCHAYWDDGYDDAGGDSGMHIMNAATSNYANSKATVAANTTVAWAASTYCRSCHDAGFANARGADATGSNFPHYTSGAARFLMSAADYTAYSADTSAGATEASQDGVCMKCHRSNSVDTGIGLDF